MDAIFDWVSAGSGLVQGADGIDTVQWADQKPPRPSTCHISMRIKGELGFGQDWMTQSAAPAPVPGADLEFTMTGPRVSTLVLECFAGDQKWGAVRPDRKLSNVIAARNLPTISYALRRAGVGFGPIGPVQVLELARGVIFEPRALVEITIHTISRVSELGTWIERVEVAPTITANGQEIVLPTFIEPPEVP